MKKTYNLAFLVLIILCLSVSIFIGCGSNNTPDTGKNNDVSDEISDGSSDIKDPGGNALVAYFSRRGENWQVGYIEKGNTEIVAEMIAEETNADLFAIQPVVPYPDEYSEMLEVSRRETNENARPAIKNTIADFEKYDVIFIGYPIWNGTCPMIIRTFTESYDFSGKTVIPFCTHAGSGLGSSVSAIRSQLQNATVLNGLAVQGTTAQNNREEAKNTVTNFIKDLNIDFSGSDEKSDEQALKEVYTRRLKAMVEQDTATLAELMDDNLILRHITGATQTKQEWLDDIAAGNMYYININNTKFSVAINGNRAEIEHTNIIEALIYGSHGTWTLSGTSYYEKRDGKWIWTNAPTN